MFQIAPESALQTSVIGMMLYKSSVMKKNILILYAVMSMISLSCEVLDDDMGKIFVACLEKGYSTEDERRRYDRLDAAYTSMGGNGEAARRKPLFHAIKHEEEWMIDHKKG